ncbi:unnamed protein product [Amoebophrya sp. A25]|nr:unnamed protein product [Amoebophrya sp. A25]|eukprot:GSA25T00003324001.1
MMNFATFAASAVAVILSFVTLFAGNQMDGMAMGEVENTVSVTIPVGTVKSSMVYVFGLHGTKITTTSTGEPVTTVQMTWEDLAKTDGTGDVDNVFKNACPAASHLTNATLVLMMIAAIVCSAIAALGPSVPQGGLIALGVGGVVGFLSLIAAIVYPVTCPNEIASLFEDAPNPTPGASKEVSTSIGAAWVLHFLALIATVAAAVCAFMHVKSLGAAPAVVQGVMKKAEGEAAAAADAGKEAAGEEAAAAADAGKEAAGEEAAAAADAGKEAVGEEAAAAADVVVEMQEKV